MYYIKIRLHVKKIIWKSDKQVNTIIFHGIYVLEIETIETKTF